MGLILTVYGKIELSELALAVTNPSRIRELLSHGATVTPDAVTAAIESSRLMPDPDRDSNALFVECKTCEPLELLLAAGADPKLRPDNADNSLSGVKEGWASGDDSTVRDFFTSRREWYALHRAAKPSYPSKQEKLQMASLQVKLLKHGADPYALFRQPLKSRRPCFVFPGVDPDEETEESDAQYLFDQRDKAEHWNYNVYERELQSELARTKAKDELDSDQEDEVEDGTELAEALKNVDIFAEYGVRSVIHALLEEGAFVEPIL